MTSQNVNTDTFSNISIDIETFSDADLKKCGVYKYAESPNFEILLFAYSLDNTLGNLRLCKKQQNEFNTKVRSDNTTGYKGVSFSKSKNKYRSYINKDGHYYHLGYFNTKEEAALTYNQKAISLFGEYARLNEI